MLWLVNNRSSVTAEAEHCVTVAKLLNHNHEITSSLICFNFAQLSAKSCRSLCVYVQVYGSHYQNFQFERMCMGV